MQKPNQFFDYIFISWPRVLAVKRVFPANMDVAHALARPMLRAELTSPIRFHGPKPQRTDSVITVQSRLRGLPYFDALTIDTHKRAELDLSTQSPPRAPTGTRR